ncbi:MAG: phosphoenolpyruvate carboxylase, partial [Gammaproteobacteria bacterium]|nr:phosphoenolpyruvate carboxylase [Gammaproteobacteria bacterium]
DIEFAEKDEQLRRDVHELGAIVGSLLREQCGEDQYRVVEEARRVAISRREGDAQASARLDQILGELSLVDARDFVRAFSTFFQVVNTAEQVHRLRRRRDYPRTASIRQPGSVAETVFRLQSGGVDLDGLQKLLTSLRIVPVFSAHPTVPTRRTILRKHQTIARRLVDMQNLALTQAEFTAVLDAIRTEVTAIWQTEESPSEARTVADELEHVLFFFTDVIYRAIPLLYEALENSIRATYGTAVRVPTIVRFASWIGGDMDDNPDITARTIRETLARQRSLILDLYHRECRDLSNKLSQSTSRVTVSAEVQERIRLYAGHFGHTMGSLPLRHRDMPYRVLLRLMVARLQATHDDGSYPYESAEEFLADVELIASSLERNRGAHAGLFAVRRLIRRVETFGFHFLGLDLKQSALGIRGVVGRCLNEPDWLERSPDERAERIREALRRNESPCETLDNESKRALAIFQAVAFCRRKYGQRAIGPFIVSMSHGVDDVLSVMLLGRWGDLHGPSGSVPLDITPLFETTEDLANAHGTMRQLLQDPIYWEHLWHRDRRQIVMIGYSDSNKDGGLAAARWALKQTQSALVQVLDDAGVEFTLFHGRGGTISRGGGKTHAAVLGSPPGAVRARLRALEQGELVSIKYGVRGVALRTLEQAMGSVALATALPERGSAQEMTLWHDMAEELARVSREKYKSLVYETPGFYEYFRAATPVDVIERMQAGPGHEAPAGGSIEDLHGVPWTFAWTQSRHILPGWYGFGTGLRALTAKYGAEAVRSAAREWYFLRALIGDVEMVLAKADLTIASRYSALAGNLHERFFGLISEEFELCVEQVLDIRQQQVLLEGNPALRRSIRLRNPYVDPMSMLQMVLLRRWREGSRQDEAIYSALVASINGIVRGLQDSG